MKVGPLQGLVAPIAHSFVAEAFEWLRLDFGVGERFENLGQQHVLFVGVAGDIHKVSGCGQGNAEGQPGQPSGIGIGIELIRHEVAIDASGNFVVN